MTEPSQAEIKLRGELTHAFDVPLGEVFKDELRGHRETFSQLASVVSSVNGNEWQERPDLALMPVIRQAIKLVPADYPKSGKWQSKITLREAAAILCGLDEQLRKPDGRRRYTYSELCSILDERAGFDLKRLSKSTFRRHLASAVRDQLADILINRQDELRAMLQPVVSVAAVEDRASDGDGSVADAPATKRKSLAQPTLGQVEAPQQPIPTPPRQMATTAPPAPDPQLAKVIDRLATAVRQNLEANEKQHQVNNDLAIQVRWVNAPPELVDKKVSYLELTGQLDRIDETFASVPSRRLVVLGGPGAGKTILAEQFALGLLRNRPALNSEPAPVIFAMSSWNPTSQTLDTWMAERLVAEFPFLKVRSRLLGARKDGMALARQLLDERRILLIFDGLDEMADELRPVALKAINDALRTGEPFLLTSRSHQYTEIAWAGEEHLIQTAVVELEPITVEELTAYLPARTLVAIPKWKPVLDRLTAEVEGQEPWLLLPALQSPLMVAMARSAFSRPGADPRELLEMATSFEVVDYLFDKFVEAAYAPQTAQAKERVKQFRWDEDRATRSLEQLAINLHLRDTRDFEWWRLGSGDSKRAKLLSWFVWCAGLAAFEYGLGLTSSWLPLLGGLLAWTWVSGVFPEAVDGTPTNFRTGGKAETFKFVMSETSVITIGLPAFLLAAWLASLPFVSNRDWPLDGLPLIASIALLFTILATGESITEPVNTSATGPIGLWRHSRRFAFMMSAGIVATLLPAIYYLAPALSGNQVSPLWLLALGFCLLLWALLRTHWGQWQIRRIWVAVRYRQHWMSVEFLADAHRRGILRQNGATYHFRHAMLQDRLAARRLASASKHRKHNKQDIIFVRHSLAVAKAGRGRHSEALEELRALHVEIPTGDDELDLRIRLNVIHVAFDVDAVTDLPETEAELRTLSELLSKMFGPDSYMLFRCRMVLILTLLEAWRFGDETIDEYNSLVDDMKSAYGEDHPVVESFRVRMWETLQRVREGFEQYRADLKAGLDAIVVPLQSVDITDRTVDVVGRLATKGISLPEATAELRSLVEPIADTFGANSYELFLCRSYLVAMLFMSWRFDEADAEHNTLMSLMDAMLGEDHPRKQEMRESLAQVERGCREDQEASLRKSKLPDQVD